VAVDGAGNLFIAEYMNGRIRKVNATTHLISTVAGIDRVINSPIDPQPGGGYNGDNRPATTARLFGPRDIALDGHGNLFIADALNHRIRRVDADTGLITTVAGTGTAGYNGDYRKATTAQLNDPGAVTVDRHGNVLIADIANARIRRVDARTGQINTVVGTGTPGYNGDNKRATTANVYVPVGLHVDRSGRLYIADTFNAKIRVVNLLWKPVAGQADADTEVEEVDGP
jgi:sugar lactone lactonase YvrE